MAHIEGTGSSGPPLKKLCNKKWRQPQLSFTKAFTKPEVEPVVALASTEAENEGEFHYVSVVSALGRQVHVKYSIRNHH